MKFKNFIIYVESAEGRRSQVVETNYMTIGRSYSADFPLIHSEVSRSHLKVYCESEQIFIEDLNSKNGTFLRGERLTPHQVVSYKPGEPITLGKSEESVSIVAEFMEGTESVSVVGATEDSRSIPEPPSMAQPPPLEPRPKPQKRSPLSVVGRFSSEPVDKKAQREADKIMFNAESLAKQVEKRAQRKAEMLLEDAHKKAELLERTAKSEAEEISESIVSMAKKEASERKAKAESLLEKAQTDAEALRKQTQDHIDEKLEEIRRREEESEKQINLAKNLAREEMEDFAAKKEKYESESMELETQLIDLREQRKRLSLNIAEVRLQQQTLQAELEEMEKAAMQKQDEMLKEHERLKLELQQDTDHLDALYTEKRANLEKVKAEHASISTEIQTLVEERDALDKWIFDGQARVEKAEKTIARLSQQKEKLEKSIEAYEESRHRDVEQLNLLKSETQMHIKREREHLEREVKARLEKLDAEEKGRLQKLEIEERERLQKLDKEEEERLRILESEEKRRLQILDSEEKGRLEILEAEETERRAALVAEIKEEKEKVLKEAHELRNQAEATLESAKAESQQTLAMALAEEQRLIKEVNERARVLMDKVKSEAELLKEKSEEESERLIVEARSQILLEREELNKLKDVRTKQVEMDMADLKLRRTREMEDELQALERDFFARQEDAIGELSFQLRSALITKIKPKLKQANASELIGEIEDEVNLLTKKVLRGESVVEDEAIEGYFPYKGQQALHSPYMKKAAILASFAVLAVIISYQFSEEIGDEVRELASVEKSARDMFIEKIEETRRNKPKFTPKQDLTYRETYTDRVIYTQGYTANELDGSFREKWILSLNKFLVKELKLSENVIVPFIARESNLVRELQGLKEAINPQFEEEGVNEMRKVEEVFINDVREMLKTEKNFARFKKFKQSFYEDYFDSQDPSTTDL